MHDAAAFPKDKKILVFAALLAIALMPRLLGIASHSLWLDEASTANMISQKGAGNMLKALAREEGTPPLFYLIEKGFVDFLGLRIGEFSLRFLPAMFGALSCVVIYYLFRIIGTATVAWLSFLLAALSNFHINISQDARSYSLLGLSALLYLYFTIQWWEKRTPRRSLGMILSLALTIMSHYYGLIWVGAVFTAAFIVKPKNRQMREFFFKTILVTGASCAILMPIFIQNLQNEISREYLTAQWLPGTIYSPLKVLLGAFLFKIKAVRELSLIDLLGIIPVIAILLTVGWLFRKRLIHKEIGASEKIVVLSAFIAFGIHSAIGWKIPTIHPRYMAHFLILLFGLIMINAAIKKPLLIATFAVLLGLNAVAAYRYYDRSQAYYEPWKEITDAAEVFCESSGNGTGLIVADYPTCLTLGVYLKGNKSLLFGVANPSDPALQFEYRHGELFGHEFNSIFLEIADGSPARRTSLTEILENNDHGIIVQKNPEGSGVSELSANRGLKNKEISVFKVFETNQGRIILTRWNTKK